MPASVEVFDTLLKSEVFIERWRWEYINECAGHVDDVTFVSNVAGDEMPKISMELAMAE